jgi:glycosyltransferase involved in cell wall biosynthesis
MRAATADDAGRAAPTARPIDVAYVIGSMITGGTQTHLLQVFRFLDRTRFAPHLYCLRTGGDLVPAVRALDVPVTCLGLRGTLRDPRDAFGLAGLAIRFRRLRPAIVHGYLLRGNFCGAVGARLAGVPVVITSKRGLHKPMGRAERFAVRVSNRLSNVITGNSGEVISFTREVERPGRVPMENIPSGIDTDRYDPARASRLDEPWVHDGGPLVGSVTTFRQRKGYATLFETIALLRDRFPDVRLVVAGESELAGPPAELAERLGITDRIVLLGRRPDVPRVLASLDVFVFSSTSEGMSNAVLEAMAMEHAVVATALGGNIEVIEDGRSGVLVPVSDAAAAADAAAALLSDPTRRRAIGRAARERVLGRYSAPAMVRSMQELYARLLGSDR